MPSRLTRRRTEASQGPEVEDNEEPQPTQATTAKGRKGKGKKPTEPEPEPEPNNIQLDPEDEDDNVAPDVDVPPFDPSQFEEQPLLKADALKVAGLAKDWDTVLGYIEKKAFGLISNIAGSVTELATKEEAQTYVEEDLEPLIREVMDLQNRVSAEKEAIEDVRQRLLRGDDVLDATHETEQFVHAAETRWEQNTSRQKYAKNKFYFDYHNTIWEARNEDAMPPLTNFIPREEADPEEDDDDIEIGGVTQDFKCPISLMTLTDPYTSTLCQHSFNRDSILEFLKDGEKQCPATGCRVRIDLRSVGPDPDLAKRAELFQKRAKRREEEQDDAEELSD